jgi:hypothetical protein
MLRQVWKHYQSEDIAENYESNFRIAMSSLFHSFTVEGINDELVIESLHKGTTKMITISQMVYSSVLNSWMNYTL